MTTVSIHHRNLQALAIEVFKALNNLSFPLMSALIKLKQTTYNLRYARALVSTNKKRLIMVLIAYHIWLQISGIKSQTK